MKIAITGIRGIPAKYGGFETSAEQTATRMFKSGHDIVVYCRKSQSSSEKTYKGIKLVYLPTFPINSFETIIHSFMAMIHAAFIEKNVDIVHAYNAASSFGGIFCRLRGKKLVITLDGIEWNREKWGYLARLVWKVATWLAFRVSNTVVCDNRYVIDFFEERYSRSMCYVPYGANKIEPTNEIEFITSIGLKPKSYCVFVGRLVKEKAVDVLINAYKGLNDSVPLVIVGDNEHNQDYVKFLKRSAGNNTLFLGFRYGKEYEQILSNALIYITASRLEGTSPSLLSSMAAGLCCLVNAIPENKETGADCVVYFDGSVNNLKEKIEHLLLNPQTINYYGGKAIERVESVYDWDKVASDYLNIYEYK